MHKYALTYKPPEASGVFNGLLSAIVAGVNNGEYANSISFADWDISNAPDQAPRGYANPNYTVCPRMDVVDPTSQLALSARAAHRRNPSGTVGYTHHHVALETLSHISAMFAKWVTEFNVLYANASLAQASIRQGSYTRLDSVREVRYTDGDVEMFLAAVGSLTDGNISYPSGQTLDVDVIYSRVMTQLQNEIGILDNLGFTVGEDRARAAIGLGTIPKTGQNVCVLSAATFDKLCAAPWRRILTLPRVRDMIREPFEQRLNVVLSDVLTSGDPFNEDCPYVSITEGDDVLYIPTHLPMSAAGAVTTWETLTQWIDDRQELSMDAQPVNLGFGTDQSVVQSGRYDTDSNGIFVDSWLNQFYDMGDLVEAVISGQISALDEGLISILLSLPIQDPSVPATENPEVIIDAVTGSTGALAAYNILTTLVEPITGSIDVVSDSSVFLGLNESAVCHSLPNGVMYIGDCGSAKATSWIRILRDLRLNFPQEVKLLLAKSGRAKKTLATTPNRIASMDSLLAEAVSSGVRDGYINMPSLAFNVTRLTRSEQEGPLFAGGSYSAINPGAISATPQMASEVNGWDRVDNSDGRYLITPDGATINMEYGTPSRFTGEWDAGRVATWSPDFVSDSIALGSGGVEVEIAANLLSYPCAPIGDTALAHRYVPGGTDGAANPYATGNKWEELTTVNNLEEYCNMRFSTGEYDGYLEGISSESYHMTRGFQRGLAYANPDDNNILGFGYKEVRSVEAISTLGRHPGLPAATTLTNADGSTFQTYLPAAMSPAALPYASYQTGPLEAPPVSQWMWDPTRLQSFGSSWHRWAGVFFSSILPHPYLPHPIAVSTAYTRLTDLVGREAPNETNVGAELAGSTSGYAESIGIPGANIVINGVRSTHNGSAQGSSQGLLAGNVSSAWKSHMTNLVAADITSTVGGLTNPGWDVHQTEADRASVLPVNEMMCLTANGCARSSSAKATMTTVLRNLNDIGSSAIAAGGYTAQVTPSNFEGETLTPLNFYAGGAKGTIFNAGQSLIISGKGLLFEGDLYTANFLDAMSWMVKTYSGEESLIIGNFSGYWAPWQAGIGWTSVFAPQVGSNFTVDNAISASQAQVLKPAIQQTGVNLVKNDWFRKATQLPAKHARMRSGSIANPWVRAMSEPGISHLRYDNSQLSPIFAAIDRSILDLGIMLQMGLTNSNFLEIQMAN